MSSYTVPQKMTADRFFATLPADATEVRAAVWAVLNAKYAL